MIESTEPAPASASAAPSAQPVKVERFTPLECAQKTGNVITGKTTGLIRGNSKVLGQPNASHRAADVVHRWTRSKEARAKDFRLTLEDYEKAIEAALRPNEQGEYVPHAGALAPLS